MTIIYEFPLVRICLERGILDITVYTIINSTDLLQKTTLKLNYL